MVSGMSGLAGGFFGGILKGNYSSFAKELGRGLSFMSSDMALSLGVDRFTHRNDFSSNNNFERGFSKSTSRHETSFSDSHKFETNIKY